MKVFSRLSRWSENKDALFVFATCFANRVNHFGSPTVVFVGPHAKALTTSGLLPSTPIKPQLCKKIEAKAVVPVPQLRCHSGPPSHIIPAVLFGCICLSMMVDPRDDGSDAGLDTLVNDHSQIPEKPSEINWVVRRWIQICSRTKPYVSEALQVNVFDVFGVILWQWLRCFEPVCRESLFDNFSVRGWANWRRYVRTRYVWDEAEGHEKCDELVLGEASLAVEQSCVFRTADHLNATSDSVMSNIGRQMKGGPFDGLVVYLKLLISMSLSALLNMGFNCHSESRFYHWMWSFIDGIECMFWWNISNTGWDFLS